MLCNSCILFEQTQDCENCYKHEAMKILGINPRQWAQIELIGVTESTENGDYATKKALCKGLADSIVIEANGELISHQSTRDHRVLCWKINQEICKEINI